jgi:hypothetical protein
MERYFRVDSCVYDIENPNERAWFGMGAEDAEKALLKIRKGERDGFYWSGKDTGPLEWYKGDADIVDRIVYWRNYYG